MKIFKKELRFQYNRYINCYTPYTCASYPMPHISTGIENPTIFFPIAYTVISILSTYASRGKDGNTISEDLEFY